MDRSETASPRSVRLNPLTREQLTELARARINLGISCYRSIVQGGAVRAGSKTRRSPEKGDKVDKENKKLHGPL